MSITLTFVELMDPKEGLLDFQILLDNMDGVWSQALKRTLYICKRCSRCKARQNQVKNNNYTAPM